MGIYIYRMISGDIDDSNTIIQQNNEENVSIEISDVSKNALNIDESFQYTIIEIDQNIITM